MLLLKNLQLFLAAGLVVLGFCDARGGHDGLARWWWLLAVINIVSHRMVWGSYLGNVKGFFEEWVGAAALKKEIAQLNIRLERLEEDRRIERKINFEAAVSTQTSSNMLFDEIIQHKLALMAVSQEVEKLTRQEPG